LLLPLLSTAQIDSFQLEIEPFTMPEMPGIHSGAIASYNGRWILIGGRMNGLHGFQSPFAFPTSGKNENAWVIDPNTKQIWTTSLAGLPIELYEPLTSSNIPFHQDGNRLYMIGGYGWSDSVNDFKTFSTLTSIDLACLHDAVISGNSTESCFRQISDSTLASCGSNLAKIDDRYYLVFGHEFNGIYAVNNGNNAFFTQKYSNEVRSFNINDDGVNLSISNYSAVHDSVNFHRRDYNLVPQIFPDGTEGLTAFSGVFQYQANLPFLNTINITPNSATVVPDFDQHLSQYHNAVLPVYDSTGNVMHSYFFGGMSRFTLDSLTGELVDDTLVPFVKTISRVSRFADGTMSEEQLPIKLPDYLGSNMKFIPASGIALKMTEIVDVNKMTESRQLAGYLIGGILSPMPNISSIDASMSSANTQVYAAYITRTSQDTGIVTKTLNVNNALSSFNCAPNPAIGNTTLNLNINTSGPLQIVAYSRQGKLVEVIYNNNIQKGSHKINWSTENLSAGVYIIKARMEGISKNISVIVTN
jgi:hypothetical protein